MTFATEDMFAQFDEKWALVCAGTLADHNAMTISWGGMGTLWGKRVVTVYVKPCRHTYAYLEKSDTFTVSFYPEACRPALLTMGTASGRDTDKDSAAHLTPVAVDGGVTYAQAEVTLVCRKIYHQDLLVENMPPEVAAAHYAAEAPHRMYIGEVVDILRP